MFDQFEDNSFGYYFRSIFHGLYYLCDEKLKKVGITNQQARLLGIIFDHVKSGHNISRRFLEDIMHLQGPSVTSLLNRLEEKGYLSRSVSREDKRAMSLLITPLGEKIINDIRAVFLETETKLQEGMTEQEIKQLKVLLLKVYGNLVV